MPDIITISALITAVTPAVRNLYDLLAGYIGGKKAERQALDTDFLRMHDELLENLDHLNARKPGAFKTLPVNNLEVRRYLGGFRTAAFAGLLEYSRAYPKVLTAKTRPLFDSISFVLRKLGKLTHYARLTDADLVVYRSFRIEKRLDNIKVKLLKIRKDFLK
jgi:hypothetical protein